MRSGSHVAADIHKEEFSALQDDSYLSEFSCTPARGTSSNYLAWIVYTNREELAEELAVEQKLLFMCTDVS